MAQITSIYALRRLQQQTSRNVAAAGLLAGLCCNEEPKILLLYTQLYGLLPIAENKNEEK